MTGVQMSPELEADLNRLADLRDKTEQRAKAWQALAAKRRKGKITYDKAQAEGRKLGAEVIDFGTIIDQLCAYVGR